MAYTVPDGEPGTAANPLATLTLGDAWQWDRVVSEFPPSEGYTLAYTLLGSAVQSLGNASTSSSGDYYEVRLTPTATAAYTLTGRCRLRGWVSKSGERWQVFDGYVDVLANPATATGEQRTTNEQMLEDVETMISARLASDQAEVEINGRRIKKEDLPGLYKLRGTLILAVQAERSGGKPKSTYIAAAF